MANLVICADGTWNTPEDKDAGLPAPTNVVKFFNAVAEDHATPQRQKKYYHPGVGTNGGWWDRVLGGGTGTGLNQNIMSGYKWLAVNYAPGDQIFLIGFSRGAYTVRSLGGMISRCGVLDLSGGQIDHDEIWKRVQAVFACYRDRRGDLSAFKFHNAASAAEAKHSTPIQFIGVWDTVGTLGIPDDLGLLNLIDDPDDHRFHDTELSPIVRHARHAMAIDEMRQSFFPTSWTNWQDGQDVKQVWFPGVHGDVGGGYSRSGLADAALLWMMEEAKGAGLAFRPDVEKQVKPDFHDVLHDSCTGIFSALKTEPRQVPLLTGGAAGFHPSALDRHANPPLNQAFYWRQRELSAGEPVTVDVFARERWNVTGFFLKHGVKYEFTAKGQWLDSDIPCGPAGTADKDFHVKEVVHVAASVLGRVESIFKQITGNPQADFWATRRVEDQPWLALIGLIANGADDSDVDHPLQNEVFFIGETARLTPRKSGYLYCFANDAWHAYENNKGSVSLTVTRI